ncbi:MAG: transcription-repair coupling factor, partial [Balneolaceae bacterium]
MIDKIRNAFFEALPQEKIRTLLAQQQTITLEQFTGSSLSLLLSEAATVNSRLLVVTPDIESATSYASDLQVLQGDDPLLIFPPTRRRPYDDQKIPDLSTSVQRSDVLEKLKSETSSIVITSADAICEKLISSEEFQAHSFLIQSGDHLSPADLSERLADQGYRPVRFVDEPGEYAIRGGIFDIYPFSSEYPVRLEFFGDEIESLREFDTDSQRSISFLNEIRLVPDAAAASSSEKQSLFDYLPDDTLVLLHLAYLMRTEISLY